MKSLSPIYFVILTALASMPWPVHAEGPSFDCAAARTEIEAAVCEHPDLSALDRELARLYKAAREGSTETGREHLREEQADWLETRDLCGDWGDGLASCVREAYGLRILDLRHAWPGAKQGEGIISDPFALRCQSGKGGFYGIFIKASPTIIALRWADRYAVMSPWPDPERLTYLGIERGRGSTAETVLFSPDGTEVALQIGNAPQDLCQIVWEK